MGWGGGVEDEWYVKYGYGPKILMTNKGIIPRYKQSMHVYEEMGWLYEYSTL